MNEEVKAFFEWIAMASALVGGETIFIMAIVQGLGKFVSGKAQTIAAIVVGLVFGLVTFFGFWGYPTNFYEGLKLMIFLAMTSGVPIGTYEAIKNASGK